MHTLTAAIVALLIGLAALATTTNSTNTHHTATTSATVVIPTNESAGTSDVFLDALLAAGHTGQAGDGIEGIHVPSDVATGLCVTDTDCAFASGEVRVAVGAVLHA